MQGPHCNISPQREELSLKESVFRTSKEVIVLSVSELKGLCNELAFPGDSADVLHDSLSLQWGEFIKAD